MMMQKGRGRPRTTIDQDDPQMVERVARLGAERLARLVIDLAKGNGEAGSRLAALLQTMDGAEGASFAAKAQPDAYMVGASAAMRRTFEQIRKFAQSNASVLITGESGTGKELAARAIHERSRVASGPFVAINCAALPPSLIASELFGHERGSFTGAVARKIGRIEAAHRGTVFLDEIGDMPVEMQAHLLRFVQERQIERIGGTRPISVDVRVIAATNTNLEEAVAKGRFREDLYYRLNELPLAMPALRERGDDVLLLAKFFLQKFAAEMGRATDGFQAPAERAIMAYAWPGNVRELIACVRRAVVISDGGLITAEDLGLNPPSPPASQANPGSLGEVRAKTEGQLIRETLKAKGYNVTRAASALGISRVTLYRLLEKYDIQTRRRANRVPPSAAMATERALEPVEAAD